MITVAVTLTATALCPSATAANFDTPIADAIAECLATEAEWNFDSDPAEREEFTVMDEGHSVHISDFTSFDDVPGAVRCALDGLDLPDWMPVRIGWTNDGLVGVGDYTIAWHLSGESFRASDFLIYDREVGGGQP